MKTQLPQRRKKSRSSFLFTMLTFTLLLMSLTSIGVHTYAQGTWSPVIAPAPSSNGGVMLLLSDGTVITKTFSGGADGYGNVWDRLTPDSNGSYAKGTWTSIAPMHNTRLYFSSQVLKDGRVYVGGGEYGTGGSLGEVYNPLTNVWTNAPSPGKRLSDANSEILPDGKVLQALVTGDLRPTDIYNPVANTYITGPSCRGIHNESAWVKLPDNSILFVDRLSRNSERYIPATNTWIADAQVPVDLYDPYGDETGGAVLLPSGKAFFIGSTGHNALYKPSGNTNPGVWTAAADLPNTQGAPDAAAAMMVNGKVLCATSHTPSSANHFPSPTSFYEYDYLTNTFTQVNAPGGGLTLNISCYLTNMLDLPDGSVLYGQQGSLQYYIYKPNGVQLTSGKPIINKVVRTRGTNFQITGTLFNGISEGATYGDDWQMNTNYPIVRLTTGRRVYYARTFNWNRTGVMTGRLLDTAYFSLPAGIPQGTYNLTVSANGISSKAVVVTTGKTAGDLIVLEESEATTAENAVAVAADNSLRIAPNPAKNGTTVYFSLLKASQVSIAVLDMNGKATGVFINSNRQAGSQSVQLNTSSLASGIYIVRIVTSNGTINAKLVVQ